MNDQEFQELTDRIHRIFNRLRDALDLGGVRFKLHFYRERDECGGHDDGGTTVAEIHPSWQYNSATLQIYAPSFLDYDDDEIANVLIHELVHYWVNSISRYGTSKEYDLLEERVCTEIASAIGSVMSAVGKEVATHWKKQVKGLEKELKQLQKEKATA